MFSSLFKNPRVLRLPAKSVNLNIQRVKVSRRVKVPTILLFATPLALFAIDRTSDYFLPADFRRSVEKLTDDLEKSGDKAEAGSKQKKLGDDWQKAHSKSSEQRNSPPSNVQDGATKADELFFLTVPIRTRLRGGEPYSPEDPEWSEFIKLQEDDERIQALFRNIAQSVSDKFRRMDQKSSKVLFHNIEYAGQLGIGLEVLIPLRAPSVYEIPGIRFGPRGMEWGWRPLPESYGSRLHRTLHPIVFARCFWVGFTVFWKASYLNAKSFLTGTDLGNTASSSILEVMRGPLPKSLSNATKPSPAEKKDGEADPDDRKSQIPSALPFPKDLLLQTHRSLVGFVTSESALKQAVSAFQSTFLKLQVAAWREIPRGACLIEGVVDFIGHRGFIRSRVVAIYMPAEDKFLGEPVIEAMNLFPYAPEFYQPRKRQRQQMVTADANEVTEAESVGDQAPEVSSSSTIPEEQPPSSNTRSSLGSSESEKRDPPRIDHGNSIEQKGNDTDEKLEQSKIGHDENGDEKSQSTEKKSHKKDRP